MNSHGKSVQLIAVGFFCCIALIMACSEDDDVDSHAHSALDITSGTLANARLHMGSGNGLDADRVDGLEATAFATAAHNHDGTDIDSGTVPNARLNTGSGNGLDADTVDGLEAAAFVLKAGDAMTGNLTMGNNQIVNFRAENAASAPGPSGPGNAGRIYFDTTSGELMYSDGALWVQANKLQRPIHYKGGATSAGNNPGNWIAYTLAGTLFNTATGYVTAAASGTITVNTPGYYRIYAWAQQSGLGSHLGRIMLNAAQVATTSNEVPSAGSTNSMEYIGYLATGDSFFAEFYSINGVAYASSTSGRSGVYVHYMGP